MADKCCQDGCEGTEVYHDDDYGSLGDGGSYEIYVCDTCGYRCWRQLPD